MGKQKKQRRDDDTDTESDDFRKKDKKQKDDDDHNKKDEERCKTAETVKKAKFPVKIKKTIWQTAEVLATIQLGPLRCAKDCNGKNKKDDEDDEDNEKDDDSDESDENDEVDDEDEEDHDEDDKQDKCKKVKVVTKVKFPVKIKKTIWQTVKVPAHIKLDKVKCTKEKYDDSDSNDDQK